MVLSRGIFNVAAFLVCVLAVNSVPNSEAASGRGVKAVIGTFEPQGTSETSRLRPSRRPVSGDRYVTW